MLPETENMKSVLFNAQPSLGPRQQPGGQWRNYLRFSVQGGKAACGSERTTRWDV